ncbi:MAG: hypothetical protein IKU64_06125 [Bacteroides sp.]|nr:hypothetical protein [Bacteroides sp.]
MWYKNENGSITKPEAVDSVSSNEFVYVRKNFAEIAGAEEVPAHWEWMETKIPKDAFEIWLNVQDHNTALDDVYAALTELAELIVEEE